MSEWIRAPDSSSGVSDQQSVGSSPGRDTCVLKKDSLNHYCYVLRMGCKAVGPVCCVMHVKEPSTLIVKRRGSPLCFLVWLAAHCATAPCKPLHST